MIELHQLDYRYPGMEQALFARLELDVKPGTICGMLGPNGAGKSTLLKILAGLLFPAAGTCRVNGYTPSDRHPEFLADLFLLPEEIHVPALTADEYEQRYAGFYPGFDAGVFDGLLREFDLPRDHRLHTLSQGQKKKFLLAFGIATNTRLLIMDEPSNGLDIPSKSQFRRVLVSNFSEDRSFIISTHQVHDLDGLIDSVMLISSGSILLNADLDTVSSRIAITTEAHRPDGALYFEESLQGYEVVRLNDTGLEARVDLGLLYGFVTSNTPRALQVLEGEVAHV